MTINKRELRDCQVKYEQNFLIDAVLVRRMYRVILLTGCLVEVVEKLAKHDSDQRKGNSGGNRCENSKNQSCNVSFGRTACDKEATVSSDRSEKLHAVGIHAI
jgi:hypothetical protein